MVERQTPAAPAALVRPASPPREPVGTGRPVSLLHLGAAGRLGIALAALPALWLGVHWALD